MKLNIQANNNYFNHFIKHKSLIDFNIIQCYFNIIKGACMNINTFPKWITNLEEEDFMFIKRFILASGSLKELASNYSVTYPTVRLRLDRIIQKIKLNEESQDEPFIDLIKKLVVSDELDYNVAKLLINEFKNSKKGEE